MITDYQEVRCLGDGIFEQKIPTKYTYSFVKVDPGKILWIETSQCVLILSNRHVHGPFSSLHLVQPQKKCTL